MIGADRGQNAIIVLPQANLTLTADMVEEVMQSMLEGVGSKNDIFMAQCEMRLPTITAGLRRARNAGLITMLNAAPASREPFSSGYLPCRWMRRQPGMHTAAHWPQNWLRG